MQVMRVNPKVIKLWRIKAMIVSVITLIAAAGIYFLVNVLIDSEIPRWIQYSLILLAALFCIFSILIHPTLKGEYWGYSLREDYIVLKTGILFRNQITIPIVRIQNVESNVGPIASVMHLTAVRITTASTGHKLPEMCYEDAQQLQIRIQSLIQRTVYKKPALPGD